MDEFWKIAAGVLATILTALIIDWFKRRNQLRDRRDGEHQTDEDCCDELKRVCGEMMIVARNRKQQVRSLAALVDTKPDYVWARLKELSDEPDEFERWNQILERFRKAPGT